MFSYDDNKLQRLFAELEPKRRLQALKGAFRKEANRVRKIAVNNLRASIRTDKNLASGIRAVIFKRTAGFRVTVGTKKATKKSKKEYGFHTNRQGLKKPILIWAEDGTKERETHTYKMWGRYKSMRKRKGHKTGHMKAYCFMLQTKRSVKGTVTDSLHNEIRHNVIKIANKYGCNT